MYLAFVLPDVPELSPAFHSVLPAPYKHFGNSDDESENHPLSAVHKILPFAYDEFAKM